MGQTCNCLIAKNDDEKDEQYNDQSNSFILTWDHICNAINHELYEKIAIETTKIIQQNNIPQRAIVYSPKFEAENEDKLGLEFILNALKESKLEIDGDEMQYIRQLHQRALHNSM